MTDESLFNVYRRMCRIREFEAQLYQAIETKRVKCFVYLSSGQESIAASVAEVFAGQITPVFCQHRGRAAYISFGGDVIRLRDELLRGVGGDPMIHDKNIKFFGHSGLVADQVPIAVGYALASGEPVICFMGDSTPEEDVFAPALAQAAHRHLPVLFIVEDNGLSVITETAKRRSFDIVKVANAYGVHAEGMIDDPEVVYELAAAFLDVPGPMLLNVTCNRQYRHVGTGIDTEMAWDRMSLFRERLRKINELQTVAIESAAKQEMSLLWQ